MTNHKQHYELGMIGLGVMGRNLLLNMADHGFSVAGHDTDQEKVDALEKEAENREIYSTSDVKEFIGSLKRPRAVMMLVPAGAPVDSVIEELEEYLEPGDLIIDGGNSYFKDTDVRSRDLTAKGLHFLGVGVSGGEEGARHGPSIMPGGPKEAYERIRPIFEAAAAKVEGTPCVTWLGPKSAGHYVKMVHNGIEYGIMQLIAESYDLMKRGLQMNDDELHEVFTAWDKAELNGYLIEITGHIFAKKDEKTGKKLIDQILDVAKQKGTGMWTSQSAMELQVPIPTIDLAVSMRDLSVFSEQREQASKIGKLPSRHIEADKKQFVEALRHALFSSILLAYVQGFALLVVASKKYNYGLDFTEVPQIWRGGCIIRSSLLDDITEAFRQQKNLPNLLLDSVMTGKVLSGEQDLRKIICHAVQSGIPAPGMMASLGYLDAFRSAWVPANLIQAQRDYFGAHTYERVDAKGTFHTEWEKK